MERSFIRRSIARAVTVATVFGVLGACALPGPIGKDGFDAVEPIPQSVAARASGNTYIPVDPLTVTHVANGPVPACREVGGILNALPDNSVRVAITQFGGHGKVSGFGSSVGIQGESYRVIIDYITADTVNETMGIAKYTMDASSNRSWAALFNSEVEDALYMVKRESFTDDVITLIAGDVQTVCQQDTGENCGTFDALINRPALEEEVNIPVYVGVGIRITANVTVLEGSVNLSGLGPISAAAQANRVSGSLIIQTLGITGSKVTTALPLPSELTPNSIQVAIQSMATIKSALFSTDDSVVITPRVVGFYDPLGIKTQQYVNAVVTQLAREPIEWTPNCKLQPTE